MFIILVSKLNVLHNFLIIIGRHKLKSLEREIFMFHRLCCCAEELNHAFSLPVFILLMIKLIGIMGNGFTYILGVSKVNSSFNDTLSIRLYTLVIEWIRILLILSSADIPIREVFYFKYFDMTIVINLSFVSGSFIARIGFLRFTFRI